MEGRKFRTLLCKGIHDFDERTWRRFEKIMTPRLSRRALKDFDGRAAEDAVQTAYKRLIRKLRNNGPVEDPAGYLFTILTNGGIDEFRRRASEKRKIDGYTENIETKYSRPCETSDRVDESGKLWRATERMPRNLRSVLRLHFLDISRERIGWALDLRMKQVDYRIKKGLNDLEKAVKSENA